ncbi:MAG: ABC transporter ATP-binding protein [Gaiellaceae bacterium]
MTAYALKAEGLSKQYEIGTQQRYAALRDVIADAFAAPVRRLRSGAPRSSARERIWALQDVSFEVAEGEAVGIIGANGAGKSTLLKILSRITEPTRGEARVRGRVASLLEVGTGFHPELTGRENISLNGAILGMRRRELARRFDEIVEFSGVETFIDTPVKRYSSGMQVRLAFAVAAHLEPDILLVDEVLAVGDAAFQAKCLGKMGDVAGEGRTVIFVSHNLAALANLCRRSVLLVNGRKHLEGPTRKLIETYLGLAGTQEGERVWPDPETAPGNSTVRLHAVRIRSGGTVTAHVDIEHPVAVEVEYLNLEPGARLSVSIHVFDKMGVGVLASANMPSATTEPDEWYAKPHPLGLYRSVCTLPGEFLNEGRYTINAVVLRDSSAVEVIEREAVAFTVHDTGVMRKEYGGEWLGVVRPRLPWKTEPFAGPTVVERAS